MKKMGDFVKTAIFAIIGAIAIIAFSCSNEGGGFFAKLFKIGGSAMPVTVESVTIEDRTQDFRVPAALEQSESIEVTLTDDSSTERVFVQEGEVVNAGDQLFKLSEQDISLRLAKRRSDLKDAQANLEKNAYFLKNRDRLFAEGRIDRTQYDSISTDVTTSEAAVEKIQLDITKLEDRARDSIVTAPTAGVISKINTASGLAVLAGKPIMSIVKADPITAAFRVPAANSSAVRPGMTMTMRFPDLSGETVEARVTGVGAEIDPKDNTFQARVSIPNSAARYRAGMRVEALFSSPEKQRFFLIPEEALIKERRAFFVFTVSKGVAHKVQVIPNETVGTRVEITRGLSEEDLVVVKGADKLTEGAVVDIWGGKTTR